jgi:hypothetical protein
MSCLVPSTSTLLRSIKGIGQCAVQWQRYASSPCYAYQLVKVHILHLSTSSTMTVRDDGGSLNSHTFGLPRMANHHTWVSSLSGPLPCSSLYIWHARGRRVGTLPIVIDYFGQDGIAILPQKMTGQLPLHMRIVPAGSVFRYPFRFCRSSSCPSTESFQFWNTRLRCLRLRTGARTIIDTGFENG